MAIKMDTEFLDRLTADVRQAAERLTAEPGSLNALAPHGTTIGAYIIAEGQKVVAFSDGKISMGNRPASLDFRKIFKIDRHTRMLISGSLMLGKEYASALRSWVGYSEDLGNPLMARAKSNALARMLMRGMNLASAGIICVPILATYDTEGKRAARIFTYDPMGSEIERHEYVVTGSGEAIGSLLRDRYRSGGGREMDEAAGIELAEEMIRQTPDFDSFSGGRAAIEIIDSAGVRRIGS